MTEAWSRRQLLKRAGTAAVGIAGFSAAGLSVAGCGTRAAARTVSDSFAIKGVRRFESRPDLAPPVVSLSTTKSPSDPGFIMLATVASGPGQGGTMILRTSGELVWFKPDVNSSKMDFNVQTFQGEPVLTWWEGRVLGAGYGEGVGMIADASYQTIHKVNAANGLMADLHELNLTPRGTALITAYRQRPADLSAVGGPVKGYVLSGVAQEIDIASGKLLFEWDSWDHVPLAESMQPFHYRNKAFGIVNRPFDYFHINSLSLAPDGDLLISSRNCWTVYKVSRTTGKIVWRMNGKKSDYTFGPGARFYWQHHVRAFGDDKMTVFDNGADPVEEKHSRAIVLNIDNDKKHVTLANQYIHPGAVLLSDAMGSAQLLPDGRMFVGWGTHPYFSEFASDGKLLLDGQITKGDPSFRAFLADWSGDPIERPAISAQSRSQGTTVYASWNGATKVASWTIYAGSSYTSLKALGSVNRTDFETAAVVSDEGPFFAVQANDAAGHALARSATVHVTAASPEFVDVDGSCGSSNCGY
jgi:Arylsulfotransferase (ASST)